LFVRSEEEYRGVIAKGRTYSGVDYMRGTHRRSVNGQHAVMAAAAGGGIRVPLTPGVNLATGEQARSTHSPISAPRWLPTIRRRLPVTAFAAGTIGVDERAWSPIFWSMCSSRRD
jgi:hypothetical protein